MKHFLSIFLIFSYCHLFAQEAGVDTSWKKVVKDFNYFISEAAEKLSGELLLLALAVWMARRGTILPGTIDGKIMLTKRY
jgi:hypothetical protein